MFQVFNSPAPNMSYCHHFVLSLVIHRTFPVLLHISIFFSATSYQEMLLWWSLTMYPIFISFRNSTWLLEYNMLSDWLMFHISSNKPCLNEIITRECSWLKIQDGHHYTVLLGNRINYKLMYVNHQLVVSYIIYFF